MEGFQDIPEALEVDVGLASRYSGLMLDSRFSMAGTMVVLSLNSSSEYGFQLLLETWEPSFAGFVSHRELLLDPIVCGAVRGSIL